MEKLKILFRADEDPRIYRCTIKANKLVAEFISKAKKVANLTGNYAVWLDESLLDKNTILGDCYDSDSVYLLRAETPHNVQEVIYVINNRSDPQTTKFDITKNVYEFIDHISMLANYTDLFCVWMNSELLDYDTPFDRYYKPTTVFAVTNNPVTAPTSPKHFVRFRIDNETESRMEVFSMNQKVSDFIDHIKNKLNNQQLCSLLLDDKILDNNDSFDEVLKKTNEQTVFVVASTSQYHLITTICSPELLMYRSTIQLNDRASVNDVKDVIFKHIRGVGVPDNSEMFVFLPGGTPFVSGTIAEWCSLWPAANNHIYVIVTSPGVAKLQDALIKNLCDCGTDDMKLLLSPLCQSTDDGYIRMACMLGHLQYDGIASERMFLALAKLTGFAPLICAMYRIMDKSNILGLDVICITAVLQTVFKIITRGRIPDGDLLSHTLELSSVIISITDNFTAADFQFPNMLANESIVNYYEEHGICNSCVVWPEDLQKSHFETVQIPTPESYDNIFESVTTFKLRSLCDVTYSHSPLIIKLCRRNGSHYIFLFLGKRSEHEIDVIRPTDGKRCVADTRKFLAVDNEIDECNEMRVDQIINVCFVNTSVMKLPLNYKMTDMKHTPESETILFRAREYLKMFLEQSSAFCISNVTGLLCARGNIGCEISHMSNIEKVVDDITVGKRDASVDTRSKDFEYEWMNMIGEARTNLLKFNKKNNKLRYPDAVMRILFITGIPEKINQPMYERLVGLTQKLIEDGIIVDSIIVGSIEDDIRPLTVLCHMTGGLSCRISSLEDGKKLFTNEALLDARVRGVRRPYAGKIEPELFMPIERTMGVIDFPDNRKKIPLSAFDAYSFPNYAYLAIENNEFKRAKDNFAVVTPKYVINKFRKLTYHNKRLIRIVGELRITIKPRISEQLHIWVDRDNWDHWRVFIQGPPDTPYANKLWSLYITFPEMYPTVPPRIRFLSVPFHPNVSPDGCVLYSMVGSGYRTTFTMIQIIDGIKDILKQPDQAFPVQKSILEMYKNDLNQFTQKAKDRSDKVAKESIRDYAYMKHLEP